MFNQTNKIPNKSSRLILSSLKKIKGKLNTNLGKLSVYIKNSPDNLLLAFCLILSVLLILFQFCNIINFQPNIIDRVSVLGTITQSLASIFAIVFSISLVAIQLCSENLSHRLISLYVKGINFIIPFILNLLAVVFNLFLLSVESLQLSLIHI